MSESVLTADYDGHNLIVVAGSPRSGTSWFQKLLASHPKIKTGKESLLFREHIGPQLAVWRETTDPKYFGTGLSCYMSEDDFLPIVKWYLVRLLEPMVGNLRPGEALRRKDAGKCALPAGDFRAASAGANYQRTSRCQGRCELNDFTRSVALRLGSIERKGSRSHVGATCRRRSERHPENSGETISRNPIRDNVAGSR